MNNSRTAMEIHGVPNDLQMADVPYLCHFAEGIVTPPKKKSNTIQRKWNKKLNSIFLGCYYIIWYDSTLLQELYGFQWYNCNPIRGLRARTVPWAAQASCHSWFPSLPRKRTWSRRSTVTFRRSEAIEQWLRSTPVGWWLWGIILPFVYFFFWAKNRWIPFLTNQYNGCQRYLQRDQAIHLCRCSFSEPWIYPARVDIQKMVENP